MHKVAHMIICIHKIKGTHILSRYSIKIYVQVHATHKKKSPLYHFATGIQCKPAVSTFSISEHTVYDFHCSLVLCHELTCVLFLTVSSLPGRAGVGPLSPPHYTWPPASPPHSGHDTPRWRPASHSTTDKLLLTKRRKVAAPAPPLFLSFYLRVTPDLPEVQILHFYLAFKLF